MKRDEEAAIFVVLNSEAVVDEIDLWFKMLVEESKDVWSDLKVDM